MSTPAPSLVINVSLDKAVYKPGDVATVTAEALDLKPLTVTVSGTTAAGVTVNGQAAGSVEAPAAETLTYGISDSLGNTWSQVSSSGGVEVFSATVA